MLVIIVTIIVLTVKLIHYENINIDIYNIIVTGFVIDIYNSNNNALKISVMSKLRMTNILRRKIWSHKTFCNL